MLLVFINVNYHIINLSSRFCFVTACHTKCVIVTNFQSFVFVKAWISLMAAYCKCLESDIRNSTQLLGVLYLWQCFGVIFVASRDKYFTVMLTRQSIFSLKFDSLIRKTPFISL